jgi:hypothetical protein
MNGSRGTVLRAYDFAKDSPANGTSATMTELMRGS